jgi:hypothetical protein
MKHERSDSDSFGEFEKPVYVKRKLLEPKRINFGSTHETLNSYFKGSEVQHNKSKAFFKVRAFFLMV